LVQDGSEWSASRSDLLTTSEKVSDENGRSDLSAYTSNHKDE